MEEAAKRRLERLKEFELGVEDKVIVGVVPPQNDDKAEAFETLESRAQQILAENTFVPEQRPSEEHINIRKANLDLKREYERRCRNLEALRKEKIDELINKRLDEEISKPSE